VIDSDPSVGIKVKRGEKEQTRWLTEEEVKAIEEAKLSSGSLVRVRDLFIFSCNCGLAYSDLMDFKAEKIERNGDDEYLYGHRIKTGQEYVVLILPKAKEILEKYNYKLPKYSNQQYNKRLKDMAKEAGVDEPLSSHWGRITAGFMALNMGVRIEVVSKMLGHSTISETQRTYSRILKRTVVAEMKSMTKKSGE
jgi:site-specific recombinase XerD